MEKTSIPINKTAESSQDSELPCKSHPLLRTDFICLGPNCKFLLLCHECTLQNLDHAKEHVNYLTHLESFWTIMNPTFAKSQSIKDRTFITHYTQSKQELENLIEKKMSCFEKEITNWLSELRNSVRIALKDSFSGFGVSDSEQRTSYFSGPRDFFDDLNRKTKHLNEQKDIIRFYIEKNKLAPQQESFRSGLLSFLSRKIAEVSEKFTQFSDKFHLVLDQEFSKIQGFLDFSDFKADLRLSTTDRGIFEGKAEKKVQSEHLVELDNFDTIPTFAHRFPKNNMLTNNILDVFGKVTLIRTIDTGHEKLEKANEGVIISQVSLISDTDGKEKLITCSKDKTVRVFDFPNLKLEKVLQGHTDWVYRFLYFPQKKLLISAGIDRTLKLWDSGRQDWKCMKTVICESSIIVLTKLDDESMILSLRSHGLRISDLALSPIANYRFNPDKEIWSILPITKAGNVSLFLGLADGSIGIIKYETNGKILGLVHTVKNAHSSLIFDIIPYSIKEKEFIISCSGDGSLRLWIVNDFHLSLEKTVKAHESFVRKIVLYRDDLLVSCSDDSSLKFWHLPEFKPIQTVKKAHGLAVYWLERYNDDILLSVGEDALSIVKFWQ